MLDVSSIPHQEILPEMENVSLNYYTNYLLTLSGHSEFEVNALDQVDDNDLEEFFSIVLVFVLIFYQLYYLI